MSDPDPIARFLNVWPRDWTLSLGGLMLEARQATGRFPESGEVDRSILHDQPPVYLGTLGYLQVVDYAGWCLRPAGRTSDARAPFLRGLELFTDLPEPKREALYAFRCACLSRYERVSGDAAPLPFRFLVSTDESSPVARVQDTPWDGDMRLYHDELSTVVDVRSFGTLVERMYARLLELHADGALEVALPGGPEALEERSRFFHTGAP